MNGVGGVGERCAQCHGSAQTRTRKSGESKLLGLLCQFQNGVSFRRRRHYGNCGGGIGVCEKLRHDLICFRLKCFLTVYRIRREHVAGCNGESL